MHPNGGRRWDEKRCVVFEVLALLSADVLSFDILFSQLFSLD